MFGTRYWHGDAEFESIGIVRYIALGISIYIKNCKIKKKSSIPYLLTQILRQKLQNLLHPKATALSQQAKSGKENQHMY